MNISAVAGFCMILLLISSCTKSVKPEELYGEWKYLKVENPNQNPPLIMSDTEVKEANPSIIFSKNDDLVIMWGGKKLSYGKFRMENSMIRYKENLPGGVVREFPFIIKEISKDKLIFETMAQDFTRVTAQKVR
ncbi:MAG: hypothetical protein H7Y13_09915 [Sphingobacteriaceae bacterium]|nr:hypothetical protein [Sphingobacteriaceae bacterium]